MILPQGGTGISPERSLGQYSKYPCSPSTPLNLLLGRIASNPQTKKFYNILLGKFWLRGGRGGRGGNSEGGKQGADQSCEGRRGLDEKKGTDGACYRSYVQIRYSTAQQHRAQQGMGSSFWGSFWQFQVISKQIHNSTLPVYFVSYLLPNENTYQFSCWENASLLQLRTIIHCWDLAFVC